jgi:N-methylhydantoinase A
VTRGRAVAGDRAAAALPAEPGPAGPGPFRIGVDVGGTFVDAAVLRDGLTVGVGKALGDPADLGDGVVAALGGAADELGLDVRALLGDTAEIVYGTTVGLNALLTRTGPPVGLVTTRGHEDAILIGRVHQKVAGLGRDRITSVARLAKPEPLVPRWRIRGIDERIDQSGREVVVLDEAGVLDAARALAAEGCRALAIAFLWSFRDDRHERRAAELIRAALPELPLSVSSEVAPVLGEYERVAATVVNAYLLGPHHDSLAALAARLAGLGFAGRLSVAQSSGGVDPAGVEATPVQALRSGPAAGVEAAIDLGRRLGSPDLVATDVGGTSFDVGLVLDGRAQLRETTIVDQFHLAVPSLDCPSIGAGGGSIAWLDPEGALHVGPRSAGAEPGPACYGRGGTDPTVTDADLLLGRLNPDALLGGRVPLHRRAAERAIGRLAKVLGVSSDVAAAGIVRVADAAMADLVRRVTMERGRDPRTLTMVAYGGAGPLHAGAVAAEVGIRRLAVPRDASVFSALGLARSARGRIVTRSGPVNAPFDAGSIAAFFAAMELEAAEALRGRGAGSTSVRREVDLRYRRQTHQLAIQLDDGPIDDRALGRLLEGFEAEYERRFGAGSAYRAAGIEATMFRVIAEEPVIVARDGRDEELVTPPERRGGHRESRATRPVWFGRWVEATPVHPGPSLQPGDRLAGPAVVDWPSTTLLLHPGDRAEVLRLGDIVVEVSRP